MRFDPQLMKDILVDVESIPAGPPHVGGFVYEGRDQQDVNRHTQILIDDGFIDAANSARDHQNVPIKFAIYGLTMKGHDFLAKAKNDTAWNKTLRWAKEQGSTVSAAVTKAVLEQAIKSVIGGP